MVAAEAIALALIWVNARQLVKCWHLSMADIHPLPEKWLLVSIAPPDADLEVCVMDRSGVHALIFPVRKGKTDWVDAKTNKQIDIAPTHWRKWNDSR